MEDKKECCGRCEGRESEGRGCCGWGGHHYSLARIVLAMGLLLFVFWAGVKLGEIKSLLGKGGWSHGYRYSESCGDWGFPGSMMRGYGPDFSYGQRMMRQFVEPAPDTTVAPKAE